MMKILGQQVSVVSCSIPSLVGVSGTLALESMRMITIVSQGRKVNLPKRGSVLRLKEGGGLVVGDEMYGRLEERLSRGSRV